MNVEIGAEAALFPEKEYRKGIFVAVYIILWACHWEFEKIKSNEEPDVINDHDMLWAHNILQEQSLSCYFRLKING